MFPSSPRPGRRSRVKQDRARRSRPFRVLLEAFEDRLLMASMGGISLATVSQVLHPAAFPGLEHSHETVSSDASVLGVMPGLSALPAQPGTLTPGHVRFYGSSESADTVNPDLATGGNQTHTGTPTITMGTAFLAPYSTKFSVE